MKFLLAHEDSYHLDLVLQKTLSTIIFILKKNLIFNLIKQKKGGRK